MAHHKWDHHSMILRLFEVA